MMHHLHARECLRLPPTHETHVHASVQVELWCPKDGNPVRAVLGALKKVADPIDLKVYRNVVSDGRVYVRVYEGEM